MVTRGGAERGVGSMTEAYRGWPDPAKAMAVHIDAAVSAARSADSEAFSEAVDGLRSLDREQLTILLGAVTRDLLERSHPDGLDSEDAEQVMQSCIRWAAAWYRELDSDCLIRSLTGALGVSEQEDQPMVDSLPVVTHGLLLITDQLATSGQHLPPLLDAALSELRRAQTIELP